MQRYKIDNNHEVIKLSSTRCNSYLVITPKMVMLVDPSMKMDRIKIVNDLRKLNIEKISCVFLTHNHYDHVENASFFQKQFDCPVYIGKYDFTSLAKGSALMPQVKQDYNIINKMSKKLATSLKVDKINKLKPFEDGISVSENIKFISTPGHTIGSMSILVADQIAIIGDTMMNNHGNLYPSFVENEQALMVSWDYLSKCGCKAYLPGHGEMFNNVDLKRNLNKVRSK